MLKIGLTGGIGSGKTAVAELFRQQGVPILDCDVIARELVAPGQPALKQIVAEFGESLLLPNGALDRKALRAEIFAKPQSKAVLEAILHPLIQQALQQRLTELTADYVIIVIPLLLETIGWDWLDRILVVNLPAELQQQRAAARDNVTVADIQAIMATQALAADRLAIADDIIDNSGNFMALQAQVVKLQQQYQQQAADAANLYYEQPLTEQIRLLLRLEYLFGHLEYQLKSNNVLDAHNAIRTLADIADLLTRVDVRREVLKELERQHNSLKRHVDMKGVDQQKLLALLQQQSTLLDTLYNYEQPYHQAIKTDALFNSIRQRLTIPGGTCDFDLPNYHYWSNLPPKIRRQTLDNWSQPLKPLIAAVAACLDCIRNSAHPVQKQAEQGYFEEMLDQSNELQLVRVILKQQQACYPAISAGRHRLSIRFLDGDLHNNRTNQVDFDLDFGLMLCSI